MIKTKITMDGVCERLREVEWGRDGWGHNDELKEKIIKTKI